MSEWNIESAVNLLRDCWAGQPDRHIKAGESIWAIFFHLFINCNHLGEYPEWVLLLIAAKKKR